MTFPRDMHDRLGYYVYRLIDPRSGETFYIGKGVGNRVFGHANGELDIKDNEGDDDNISLKQLCIRSIINAGFEVQHIIHRHGLNEREAFEVEAALIDAYPGLTNIMNGQGSNDRGARHALELIQKYSANEIDFSHSVVAISIPRSIEDRSIYEAVRGCWVINRDRAENVDYILAENSGIVVGVYKAKEWVPADPEHCDWLEEIMPKRSAFNGDLASSDIQQLYVGKRLPARSRGSVSPIRYFGP